MGPERRVSASEYYPAADLDSIRKVDFMSGGDDAAITKKKNRVDLVDDFGIRNGVDLVHPNDLAVASQTDFRSAANDIQVTDTHVIFNREFLDARDDVEMAHLHVVGNVAFAGVDDAKTNANAFADSVSEAQAIDGALEE